MLRVHTHKLLIPAEYFLFRNGVVINYKPIYVNTRSKKKDSHIGESRQTNAKRTRYLLRKKIPALIAPRVVYIYIYYFRICEVHGKGRPEATGAMAAVQDIDFTAELRR